MKLIIAESEHTKSISYRMRYDVMCLELGWIAPETCSDEEERDEYDDSQSIIFLATDDKNVPIGTARLILEGHLPLPIERYFDLDTQDRIEKHHGLVEACAEGSRFIVPGGSDLRRHEVTTFLCDNLIRKCMDLRLSHMVVSLDHRVYRLFRMLKYPLHQIGQPSFYMGSMTVPTILSLAGYYANDSRNGQKAVAAIVDYANAGV